MAKVETLTLREAAMILELMQDERWKAVVKAAEQVKQEAREAVTDVNYANKPGELAYFAGYMGCAEEWLDMIEARANAAVER